MGFIKNTERKELSLPSLIDIIFLLLVFSLVTQPHQKVKNETRTASPKETEMELPIIEWSATTKSTDLLQTLMFEITFRQANNPLSGKVVYALKPSQKDSLTYSRAMEIAVHDSAFVVFPNGLLKMNENAFERCEACVFIRNEIEDYKRNHFLKSDFSNYIEIRAEKNTEFRIINYIMKRCGAYGDTIPRVVLRTLSGKEGKRGI